MLLAFCTSVNIIPTTISTYIATGWDQSHSLSVPLFKVWSWCHILSLVLFGISVLEFSANRGWNVCLMYFKQCVQSDGMTKMSFCFWLQFHLRLGYIGLLYFTAAACFILAAISSGVLADKLVGWFYHLPHLPDFVITCWGVYMYGSKGDICHLVIELAFWPCRRYQDTWL